MKIHRSRHAVLAVSFLGLQLRLINVCSKSCNQQRQMLRYDPLYHNLQLYYYILYIAIIIIKKFNFKKSNNKCKFLEIFFSTKKRNLRKVRREFGVFFVGIKIKYIKI